jgi:hypothetical protein
MENRSVAPVGKFLGLRNADRPERLPYGSLQQADNVFVDNTGTIERRPGYVKVIPMAAGADLFECDHLNYAAYSDSGTIGIIDSDRNKIQLGSGYTEEKYQWAQVEEFIAFAGEMECGMIVGGKEIRPLRIEQPLQPSVSTGVGKLPPGEYQITAVYRDIVSGIESGAPYPATINTFSDSSLEISLPVPTGYEADVYVTACNDTVERYFATTLGESVVYNSDATTLGEPLEDAQIGTYPLPYGITAMAFHELSLFVSVWDQASNTSGVYRSEPGFYHLFRLDENAFGEPGKVLGMASTPEGLVIGTDRSIVVLGADENLTQLANFGVVGDRPMSRNQEGKAIIWTKRGQCVFPPFQNMFKDGAAWKLTVPPGTQVANSFLNFHGLTQAVAITDGIGDAFNPY